MEIYGAMLSAYVARCALALRFKGAKFKVVMPKDGIKSPEFLKMNPLGKMPTMKDGATVLFESSVILEYIEAKFKNKRLVPASAKAAAQVRLIGAVFAEYIQGAIYGLFKQRDPATRDAAAFEAGVAELNRLLDVAEKLIAAKPFAAGAKFTLADCYAAPTMAFIAMTMPMIGFADPWGGRKKLARYMSKIRKDKLIGGVLKEMDQGWKDWLAAQAALPQAKAA